MSPIDGFFIGLFAVGIISAISMFAHAADVAEALSQSSVPEEHSIHNEPLILRTGAVVLLLLCGSLAASVLMRLPGV